MDYSVPPEFKAWALDALREMDKEEGQETKVVSDNQKKALADCIRRMDALVNMRMNDEISEDVFRTKSAELKADKQRMEAEMAASDDGAGDWLAVAERGFDFAERALIAFEKDDSDDRKARRSILANLGSNHEVINKILRVNADILLERISKVSSAVEEEKGTLEPTNDGLTKEDYVVIAHENPRLLHYTTKFEHSSSAPNDLSRLAEPRRSPPRTAAPLLTGAVHLSHLGTDVQGPRMLRALASEPLPRISLLPSGGFAGGVNAWSGRARGRADAPAPEDLACCFVSGAKQKSRKVYCSCKERGNGSSSQPNGSHGKK